RLGSADGLPRREEAREGKGVSLKCVWVCASFSKRPAKSEDKLPLWFGTEYGMAAFSAKS
ncbi:MAG: hypothetical protein UD963_01430, partial [Christensenellales bacterium]|nr:hypothetical protein [Christensenellales bacterium]